MPLVTGRGERMTSDGEVLVPLDGDSMPALDADTEAVAIVFLHADLSPGHERLPWPRTHRGSGST